MWVGSCRPAIKLDSQDESPQALCATEPTDAHTLRENLDRAFNGTKIYGQGFLFADDDDEATPLQRMHEIIAQDEGYQTRIKSYIGGEDIVDTPQPKASRYVMDLTDLTLDGAENWPLLLNIAREKVLPERLKTKDTADGRVLKRDWWKFFRPKPELYLALSAEGGGLLVPETSPHLCILPWSTDHTVFSHALKVLAYSSPAPFAVLQSRVHEVWARFFSSSMKDDLRYAPSDCFETFPFPPDYESCHALERVGRCYHDYRAALMVTAGEGMTKTYNRFHDEGERRPAIAELRRLHALMDRTVLRAYGWHDLARTVAPAFLARPPDDKGRGARPGLPEDEHTYQGRLHWPQDLRDEVLKRLLALNAERHRAELMAGKAESPLDRARRLSEAEAAE